MCPVSEKCCVKSLEIKCFIIDIKCIICVISCICVNEVEEMHLHRGGLLNLISKNLRTLVIMCTIRLFWLLVTMKPHA